MSADQPARDASMRQTLNQTLAAPQRIAIVGAGAIGCYLAARLTDAGYHVTLVGRGAQAQAINARGLLVRDQRAETSARARGTTAQVRRYHLRVAERLDAGAELILLAVKSQDVTDACRAMAPAVGDAPVVTLQNGLRADELAARELGAERIAGGVVMCATSFTEPGEVVVQFPGWLIVGEPFAPTGERARVIVATLAAALPTFLTRDLRATRWSKLITNLNNGVCAATGLTVAELARDPRGRLLSARVMREGARVARAEGVALDHGLYGLRLGALRRDPTTPLLALLQSGMASMVGALPAPLAAGMLGLAGRSGLGALPIRGSTWQSLARGAPSEIAYLNGEIVRRGRAQGVPVPWNTQIVARVREVERTGAFVPLAAFASPDAAPPDERDPFARDSALDRTRDPEQAPAQVMEGANARTPPLEGEG